MHIVEVVYPGTSLDLADGELAFELELMLRYLEDRVVEAALSLSMYQASRTNRENPRTQWERDIALRRDVDAQIRAEVGEAYFQDFDLWRLESDRRVLRLKAASGIRPQSYSHKIPFLHAHSFLYAIAAFSKFLDELCEYEATPANVRTVRDGFDASLPMIRNIRNSALHIEDGSRRFASDRDKKQGRRMNGDGFLRLSSLEGDELCYTIDDGISQRVAISPNVLAVVDSTINRVLASFPWKGPPHVSPR